MTKVILLGGGLQGLSVAASLKECGCYVTVMAELETVLKSKFVDKTYKHTIKDYDYFLKILAVDHQDVAIPMGDASAEFLSKNKGVIKERYGTICAIPEYSSIKQVLDKSTFMTFCKEHQIPCPKTESISNDSLVNAANSVGFPALIKPNHSAGARGITKVNTIEELQEAFPIVSKTHRECTLQEFIDNQDYYFDVMLYRNADGIILGQTVIKIVRMHPGSAGSSSCCVSVVNEELVHICADCLSKLNWTGFADFDVLQRKDNLEYKIIEINPRVPASLRAAAISGINFPEIIVNDVLSKQQKVYSYLANKVLRYLGIDILWFIQSHKRFHSHPSWFNFFGKDIYYQDIYLKDVSTWVTWWYVGLKKIFV